MERAVKDINILLPLKIRKSYYRGITAKEILSDSSISDKDGIIAARVNGELVDLSTPIVEDATIEFIPLNSPEGLDIYRHSTSHVMAQGVKELYKDARLGIGPAIDNGFYYDFDIDHNFTPEDLSRIERKMGEIIEADIPFIRKVMSKDDAIRLFKDRGETYKIEIIKDIAGNEISIYQQGDFMDLCKGPHLPSTGHIKAFKLLSIAGAYWKGDERNRMLQRIYGTSFPTKEKLLKHLNWLEEAKKRDHRILGKELDLFTIQDEIGPGLILWHPKGALIRSVIEDFWKEEHYRQGYSIVYTPHMAKTDLWKTSGHWEFYRKNLFSPMDIEGREYIIKPMNCPFHISIYKSHLRSYRDLPIRYAELGTVYRYERSGVLHGLLRVRGFTQDDAHIFCRPDQLEKEIKETLQLTLYILKTFGFDDYSICVSTRPEEFIGDIEDWEKATEALKNGLDSLGLGYEIAEGEGAFYGPKIDLQIKDSLGRAWQCSTIQIDFNLPQRFDVEYVDRDNIHKKVIMIHRALLGSLERFFGCLIEHFGGAFPLWLSPVQVIILTVSDKVDDYARMVCQELRSDSIRVELDLRNEKLGLKIREAQLSKIPYMVILGEREKENRRLAIRSRDKGQLAPMDIKSFISLMRREIDVGKGSLGSVEDE